MTKSILIVLTSHEKMSDNQKTGIWLPEFTEPFEVFEEAGFAITTASIKGGRAPIDPRSINGDTDAKWGRILEIAEQTIPVDNVTSDNFDAIFMPGGHGTMFDLPDNTNLQALIADFAETNRIIGAVCHGPAALVKVQLSNGDFLVKGKRVTGFTNEEETASGFDKYMPFLLEDALRLAGAEFIGKPKWTDHVVADGNLVTGQNPQSSKSIARKITDMLQN